MKRPPRRRKIDNLIEPDMRADEARCHAAIAPLDRLAETMDRKWGVDRLCSLVSPDTASRYGSALGRLNDALRATDAEQVVHVAKVCMRGLQAMDQEAEAAGAQKPVVLAEAEIDGFHFAIIGDVGDWAPILEERPGMRVYSLREIANAVKQIHGIAIIDKIKTTFPGSEIKGPVNRKKLLAGFYEGGGDEIPF